MVSLIYKLTIYSLTLIGILSNLPYPLFAKEGNWLKRKINIEVLQNDFLFEDEQVSFFDLIPLFSKEGLGEIWQNKFTKKIILMLSRFKELNLRITLLSQVEIYHCRGDIG